jgi:hypothetical protein
MPRRKKQRIEETFPLFSGVAKAIRPTVKRLDHRRPATAIAKMKRAIDSTFRGASSEGVKSEVRVIAESLAGKKGQPPVAREYRQGIRALQRSAQRDLRFRPLVDLVHEAEASVRCAMIGFQYRIDYFDLFRGVCEPIDLLEQARRERGEPRAHKLLRAFHEVAESLYAPYLRLLWYLCDVREKRLSEPPKFGNLVRQLSRRLGARSEVLVDIDVGWMRNSAAHHHWNYLPDNDSVEMWDDNHPVEVVPTSRIGDKVKAMHSSGQLVLAMNETSRYECFIAPSGPMRGLHAGLAKLVGNDSQVSEAAKAELDALAESAFGPLNALFKKYGWTKRPPPKTAILKTRD